MFIRVKKLRKGDYAYLVKNRWTKKGARQKVVRYLGKIIELNEDIDDYFDYSGLDFEDALPIEIAEDLVAWVLSSHGFEKTRKTWVNGNLKVSFGTLKVRDGQKKAVLRLGQDFMCDYTLRRLLRFKSDKSRELTGLNFAKAFVGAGIPVPQEAFVHLFNKIYREGQTYLKS